MGWDRSQSGRKEHASGHWWSLHIRSQFSPEDDTCLVMRAVFNEDIVRA